MGYTSLRGYCSPPLRPRSATSTRGRGKRDADIKLKLHKNRHSGLSRFAFNCLILPAARCSGIYFCFFSSCSTCFLRIRLMYCDSGRQSSSAFFLSFSSKSPSIVMLILSFSGRIFHITPCVYTVLLLLFLFFFLLHVPSQD